jgi:hypothetical protein
MNIGNVVQQGYLIHKLEAAWPKRPMTDDPVALQFHPPAFKTERLGEYAKIVDYLKAQHCVIRLPSECVQDKPQSSSSH